MGQWGLKKKRIVGIALMILQVFLILFCVWGMNGEKEVYSAKEQSVLMYDGKVDEDGVYYIDESVILPDKVFLSMELPELKIGVYEVYVAFEAEEEQVSRVFSESAGYRKLYANAVSLRPTNMQKEIFYRFMLWENVDDLKIEILYTGMGKFKVMDIGVVHTRQEYSMLLAIALFSLLISLTAFYFLVGKCSKKLGKPEKKILFGLGVVFLLSCTNLWKDYSYIGDDAFFHIGRIEGIAREWMAGHFPSRLESYCILGMGYPTSIMYPEVFLWPAAFLRVMGFDIAFCLQANVIFVNLLTVILSYISFKNIFESRSVGLFGSTVYTLSHYRLYNIYDRAAVGEFTAMTFFPLICWGLVRVFSEKEEVVKDKKTIFILTFGYGGGCYIPMY